MYDANTFESEPTEQGKAALKELGIKTDIDLRKTVSFAGEDEVNGITSSPLGNDVKYVSCPMVYGNQNIFTQSENVPSIILFFETLADETNYPIAFHCLRGTDRTGALAYVLGAMMGMSEEDLLLDYLFSDLANIGNPVLASKIYSDDFFVRRLGPFFLCRLPPSSSSSYNPAFFNFALVSSEEFANVAPAFSVAFFAKRFFLFSNRSISLPN